MRVKWLVRGVVAAGVVAVLAAMGPSPMPPPGPLGASVVTPPAKRAGVVRATSDWLASEARGRAVQFYNISWDGGQSATGPFVSGTALYTGFKGVIVVGRWPFVLPYGGSVEENPLVGYRLRAHIDGLAASDQSLASVSAAERARILGTVKPLLAASGVGVAYDFTDMASWASIAQEASASVTVKAALPPRTALAPPGTLAIGFSRGLVPISVSIDLPLK
ncbi:MAG TPA: hypothetical protein VIL17_07810 [Coriobacteriia bacterium]